MSDEYVIFVSGVFTGAIIVALGAATFVSSFKAEAVEAGAAHWEVHSNGKTTFEWGVEEKGAE